MSIAKLRKAISEHPFRPAGILVSKDLWDELDNEKLIRHKPIRPVGTTTSMGQGAYFDDDIFVEIGAFPDGVDYQLPSSAP
jgi:hypothetical protein